MENKMYDVYESIDYIKEKFGIVIKLQTFYNLVSRFEIKAMRIKLHNFYTEEQLKYFEYKYRTRIATEIKVTLKNKKSKLAEKNGRGKNTKGRNK